MYLNDLEGVRGHLSVSLPPLPSPTLTLNPPCLYVYPQHLCTIPRDHTKSLTTLVSDSPTTLVSESPTTLVSESLTTHQMSTHQMLSTSCSFLHMCLSSIGQASDALGQVHVTLQHPMLSRGCSFMGGLVLGGLVL
jgi:hypothetical protein